MGGYRWYQCLVGMVGCVGVCEGELAVWGYVWRFLGVQWCAYIGEGGTQLCHSSHTLSAAQAQVNGLYLCLQPCVLSSTHLGIDHLVCV